MVFFTFLIACFRLEIVGSAELGKREHENKTGRNGGEQGRRVFAILQRDNALASEGNHADQKQ